MELKKSSVNYRSFIAENLKSFNQFGNNELNGRQIRSCFHGWMVLSNHPDSVLWSIWNPLTSRMIRLPPLTQREVDSYECCLTSSPEDQCSVFLLLPEESRTIVFCRLNCKRKRFKWIEMSYAKQLRNITGEDNWFLNCLTLCNGKVYALTREYNLIHVDIVVNGNETVISLLPFVDIPIPGSGLTRVPSRDSFGSIGYFMKGSCTELFFIKVCFREDNGMIGEVYLFKLDMTSMTWNEIKDLEDAVFFIKYASDNSYSVFYNSRVTSEIGGCIHILGEMDNIISSFHVKDRTMSQCSMSCILRESQVLVWAMLECRLEVDRCEPKQEKLQDKDVEIVIKTIKVEYDSTTNESHLLSVPFHLLEMIMEVCVGIEYMRFRATCKKCCLAAPLIQWRNVSPWLMVIKQGIINFIDPIHGGNYFIETPDELKGEYNIYSSRYGWVLMHKTLNGSLVFFNPFTRSIKTLPRLRYILGSFCFSAPPTSPDCVVVGFVNVGNWHVYIHRVSHEPQSWHKYSLDFGTDDPYSFHIPRFSGRDIYALRNKECIDAFRDIGEEEYNWELVTEKMPRSCSSPASLFLSKCDQHLLLVIVCELEECVKVFKLNDSTKEWEKLDGLGKHMIFISTTSCICLESKSPEMGNKIYFPKLWQTKVVFYSLETCRYHTFDDSIHDFFVADLSEIISFCDPHTWIEPNWS